MAAASRSAIHLETRDSYAPNDPDLRGWLGGGRAIAPDRVERWHQLVSDAVGRGVEVRRARVVSEPMSDYIRWEHAVTSELNIAAGEQVRWLPRSQALDLCLPGLDFWLFDDATLRVANFAGDGELVGHEVISESTLVKHCSSAFEAIWERALPHGDYRPQH